MTFLFFAFLYSLLSANAFLILKNFKKNFRTYSSENWARYVDQIQCIMRKEKMLTKRFLLRCIHFIRFIRNYLFFILFVSIL